jgi:hypothetical protein
MVKTLCLELNYFSFVENEPFKMNMPIKIKKKLGYKMIEVILIMIILTIAFILIKIF